MHTFRNYFTVITFLAASAAMAAKAPMSDETLTSMAEQIVTGTVTKVEKKIRLEGLGTSGNTIYRITLTVDHVAKGSRIKKGEVITIEAWKPGYRLNPMPGPQGHGPIPKKGNVVTFYLTHRKGGLYVPLMPNGIKVKEPRKK